MGKENGVIAPRAALLLACITMAAIDGQINDEEINILQRLDDEIGDEWDQAMEIFDQLNNQKISFKEVANLVCNSLNEQQKASAMVNMVEISVTNGGLVDNKERLLNIYADVFDLDEMFVKKVVDIMLIRNKQDIFD